MSHPRFMMVGDSITAGFDTGKYFPGTADNRGVSGDSTVECLERISEDWFRQPAGRLFLCIGTNDLARDRSDEFIAENIRAIIFKIRSCAHPAPAITVTSLFPTRDNPPRPNERIRGLNRVLESLAGELGCSYLDLHNAFTDANGDLRSEFTDDGLHLTPAAYRHWCDLLTEQLRNG